MSLRPQRSVYLSFPALGLQACITTPNLPWVSCGNRFRSCAWKERIVGTELPPHPSSCSLRQDLEKQSRLTQSRLTSTAPSSCLDLLTTAEHTSPLWPKFFSIDLDFLILLRFMFEIVNKEIEGANLPFGIETLLPLLPTLLECILFGVTQCKGLEGLGYFC